MKNIIVKTVSLILSSTFVVGVISFLGETSVNADDQHFFLEGRYYEFDNKSAYEIDSSVSMCSVKEAPTTLGVLNFYGDVVNEYEKDGMPAYELADDSLFSLKYVYKNTLRTAKDEDWHLTDDGKKSINGYSLGDEIDYGALLYQTSFDGINWVTVKVETDLEDNVILSENNEINDIQLSNGCYYRIIVAYELKKLVDKSSIIFIDTSDYEYKKCAELYRFYAGYNRPVDQVTGKKMFFSSTEYTRCTNGSYVGSDPINSKKNSHYGWNLGTFCLSGYTDSVDDVYFKTVGDRIRLTFKLEQDINRLDGDSDLSIKHVKSGGDGDFQAKTHDMGRGELNIKYTDEEGKVRVTEYSNYLEALTVPGADTTVNLFEEGDYEIHLDYAILDEDGIDSTDYYKLSFSFKIRNGNCMVYIFDSATGAELSNGDSTENGFRIDTAKSSYPKLTIKREILNTASDGLVETDTRVNRTASDGEILTEEGFYTIRAYNRYDKTLDPAVKTIYVGSDRIMIAYAKYLNTSNPYSVAEIKEMEKQGYTISENGDLIDPPIETTVETTMESIEPSEEMTTTTETEQTTTTVPTNETTSITTETQAETTVETTKEEISTEQTEQSPTETSGSNAVAWIVVGFLIAGAAAGGVCFLKFKKKE